MLAVFFRAERRAIFGFRALSPKRTARAEDRMRKGKEGSGMTNFESELVNLHAIAERKRNTKGLIGYGSLTFYFAGCVLLSFVYFVVAIFPSLWDLGGSNPSQVHQELPDVSSSLAAIVVFGGIGYFPFRAMRKRLRCRRYYAAIAATAPQEVPPAAPDLSKRQQEKRARPAQRARRGRVGDRER